jgi:hypothetical protein
MIRNSEADTVCLDLPYSRNGYSFELLIKYRSYMNRCRSQMRPSGYRLASHSGPRNSAINVPGIVSVFLLFFSRDIVHEIVVETNRYADNL